VWESVPAKVSVKALRRESALASAALASASLSGRAWETARVQVSVRVLRWESRSVTESVLASAWERCGKG
jgi:hypothetical protein